MIKYGSGAENPKVKGEQLRDEILEKQLASKKTYVGTVTDMKNYITEYTGRKLKIVDDLLTWEEVKKQILNYDNPVCMILKEYNGTIYHSTVLCGYDYDSSTGNNKRIYIMDPNDSNRAVMSYYSRYTDIYGTEYTWKQSIRK